MTESAPRRRASKRVLRLWAWITGGLAFLAPFTALGASPNPANQALAGRDRRPVLVVRRITRVVVVREHPAQAPVRYVYAPSSGSSSTPSTGTVAAPPPSSATSTQTAPAPPPPTNTGGS